MTKNPREALILGALLHDIGKFWQRADREINYEKAEFLQKDTKDIIADICPRRTPTDRVSHVHSAWTYQFFATFEDQVQGLKGSGADAAIHLAAKHHRPDTTLQEIVRIADWLSSAQDRSAETEDEKQEVQRKYSFRKRRLHPVFNSVFRNTVKKRLYRFPLQPLTLDRDAVFPREFPSEEEDLNTEYRRLWNLFETDLIRLPSASFPAFLETLVTLLQKYTWCIPGSTGDLPDISLYDHLKTTAAIAVCLYDYFEETHPEWVRPGNQTQYGQVVQWQRSSDEPFARLICGDISGIQAFIYRISSKKAAVSLKGRSFYLQILSELIGRHLLDVFRLPVTNLIYSSGGNIYVLAPNTADFEDKIKIARQQINNALLDKFDGELFLGLGSAPMTNQDLLNTVKGEGTILETKWRAAIEAANEEKHKRFFTQATQSADFFKPYGEGSGVAQCQACGKDTPAENLIPLGDAEEDKPVQVCNHCNRFIRIGQRLKRLEWIVEIHGVHSSPSAIELSPDIQIRYELTDQTGLPAVLEANADAEFVKLIRINNTDFLPPDDRRLRTGRRACGFRFYGGNTTPVNDRDEPLTFSDLAGSGGFLRLGILRMDLDNLGNIFQQGFLRESPDGNKITDHTARYSISRLSNLSSLLDLFFTGYINTLCREKFNGQILIIYSGGDDLFLVGYWETVVNVARDIRRDFQAFTGQHPCFTISGGVALAPGKFPIHRGADLAGEAEEQAKNLDENKNAFSFMDKAVRWPDFMELEALKNEILTLTEDLDSMALISRLRRICWTYQEEKHRLDQQTLSPQDREEMINFNKWRWRMVYSLSRLTKKEKPALAERLEALKRRLTERLPSGNTIISALDIPVRWAEFTLRSETNQEEPAHDKL